MANNPSTNESIWSFSSKGRLGRRDYWVFTLTWLGGIAIGFLVGALLQFGALTSAMAMVAFFYVCIMPIHSTRRMHDVGKSGWYLLVPIYNLILLLRRGDKGENKFGLDPANGNRR